MVHLWRDKMRNVDSQTLAKAMLEGRRVTSIDAVIRAYGLSGVLKHIALSVGSSYATNGGDVKLYQKLVNKLIHAADIADKTTL